MTCWALTNAFAQSSNVIIYTEQGEPFTLFVNGAQYNDQPQSRVKASDVTADFAQIRVVFTTPGAPVLTKPLMVESGKEMTAVVRQNRKGKYVLNLVSIVPKPATPKEEVVVINQAAPTAVAPAQSPKVTQSVTTTSTTSNQATGTDQASIGINVGNGQDGLSFNLNVNVNDQGSQVGVNSSETFTSTTTTTASTATPAPQAPAAVESACQPMKSSDFSAARNSIASKSFADTKMSVAKQVVRNNCFSVSQVQGFISLFTYEEEKLEFAKLAYNKTTDQNNYYQVADSFTYEDTVAELNAFLENQ